MESGIAVRHYPLRRMFVIVSLNWETELQGGPLTRHQLKISCRGVQERKIRGFHRIRPGCSLSERKKYQSMFSLWF